MKKTPEQIRNDQPVVAKVEAMRTGTAAISGKTL